MAIAAGGSDPRPLRRSGGAPGGQVQTESDHQMPRAIIDFRNVTKTYHVESGDVKVLKGVKLRISAGEFVALMGPSGSGKSTLLNIMGCLDTPSSGTYMLDGIDVGSLKETQLADIRNKKIGFIFQNFNLIRRATVLRNVEIPMIYSLKENRQAVAEDLVRYVGLGHRMHHRPNQLSGGEQQRVAIARALVNDPAIILADEPTGSIDSHTGEKIMALLKNLHEEGNTIVVVTHDEYVAQMTNRIIRIRDGRIIREDWILHW